MRAIQAARSAGAGAARSHRSLCLLEDKQVYLVITSGGTKIQGDEDYLTPWLIHMLNFFGIKNIEIIAADQMALDYEKSIKQAESKIEELFKD